VRHPPGKLLTTGKEALKMPSAIKTNGSQLDAMVAPRRRTESPPKVAGKLAKSKDPDFRTTTLYLRKKTLANCEHRLKINDDARDMSELVEELMDNWLKDN
jgi:hypothetical protein